MKNRVIVVCDQDKHFADGIAQGTPSNMEVRSANTFTQAQHLIADRQIQIAHLCINTNISDPAGLPLIRFCRTNRPVTPISIICDEEKNDPLGEKELNELHIQS